jgi:uncharacterized membrane protein
MKNLLTILFGLTMIGAGAVHFLMPGIYTPFFPASLPGLAIVYASGVVEITLGLCTLIPRYRRIGTLGILVLMIAFLPLHVLDVFNDNPVIGSKLVAWVRLPFQFVFIAWAWFIHKRQTASGLIT